MSSPSRRTRPVIHPCSVSSCIRLRVRRKVDFPQPEGPIKACTRLGAKASEAFFTAAKLPYSAVSLSVTTRGVTLAVASCRSARLRATSTIDGEPSPDRQAGSQAQHKNHEDED